MMASMHSRRARTTIQQPMTILNSVSMLIVESQNNGFDQQYG